MATYPAYAPKWIAEGGITGPRTAQIIPAQTAAWRDGSILKSVTTGSITAPTGGASTLAAVAGPSLGSNPVPFNMTSSSSTQTQGVVTVTATTAAAAPPQTYFCVVTYDITIATESLPSVVFTINCVAGITPNVNVASAGAPATATTYAVYLSYLPNTFWLQHAVTNLGTLTAIAYPLTNSIGVNLCAAGDSTGILGVANCDSDAYFAGQQGATAGGSQFTGKRSLFGATQSFGPGWTNDAFMLPISKLQVGQLELSLVQAWNNGLIGAAVGINIDATTGYFTADTTQTAVADIQELAWYPGYSGDTFDIGARVRVKFRAAALS